MILSILFHLLGLDLIISFVLPPLFHKLSLLRLFHPCCVLSYSVYLQLHVFPFLHIFRQYTRCHPHSTDLARTFLIYLCHDVPSPFDDLRFLTSSSRRRTRIPTSCALSLLIVSKGRHFGTGSLHLRCGTGSANLLLCGFVFNPFQAI